MGKEIWRRSDGLFTVRVWPQRQPSGRTLYRVRAWFRGGAPTSRSAPSEAGAVAKAEAFWDLYQRGDLDPPAEQPDTVSAAVDQWLARPNLAARTRQSYAGVMRLMLASIGEDRLIEQLGQGALKRWLAAAPSAVTHNSYLRTARAFVRWLVKQGWLRVDVSEGIELREHRHQMRPWLSAHDWPDFLAACTEGHRIRAELVLHTGLRATELAEARWDWIHGVVGKRALSVPAHKSAKARAVPLSERAVELLDLCAERWGSSGYLVAEHRLSSLTNLTRATRKARERANAHRLEKGRAPMPAVDLHGLRRSAGARWLEVGVPIQIVSLWLGHRDITTTMRHYAGIAERTSVGWVDAVNQASARQVIRLADRASEGSE